MGINVVAGERLKTLDTLEPGVSAVLRTIGGEGALRQHFLDMGLVPDARIEFVKSAPLGDPLEFRVHGYELTLRRDDAAHGTQCSHGARAEHDGRSTGQRVPCRPSATAR